MQNPSDVEQKIFNSAPLFFRLRQGYWEPEEVISEEDIAYAQEIGITIPTQELRFPVIRYWGIELGPGWMQIVAEMAPKIERVLEKMVAQGVPVEELPGVVQIKEKLHSLRVGLRGFRPILIPQTIKDLIDEAEEHCRATCMTCGRAKPKLPTSTVVCDRCAAQNSRPDRV